MKKLLCAATLVAVVFGGICGAEEKDVPKLSARRLQERIADSVRWGLEPALSAAREQNALMAFINRGPNTLMINITPRIHIPDEEELMILDNVQVQSK